MRRAAKLTVLIVAIALVPAGGANATQSVSPTSLAFSPGTTQGRESSPLTFTYSIDAAETFRQVNPSLSGCHSSGIFNFCNFRQTNTCPVAPAAFGAGNQSCTFTVFFTPVEPGPINNTLTLTPTTAVPLSGVGIKPASKGKKCKKKGKRSAVAAKKKCRKKGR